RKAARKAAKRRLFARAGKRFFASWPRALGRSLRQPSRLSRQRLTPISSTTGWGGASSPPPSLKSASKRGHNSCTTHYFLRNQFHDNQTHHAPNCAQDFGRGGPCCPAGVSPVRQRRSQ